MEGFTYCNVYQFPFLHLRLAKFRLVRSLHVKNRQKALPILKCLAKIKASVVAVAFLQETAPFK